MNTPTRLPKALASRYRVGARLGAGASGEVFEVTEVATGERYAWKRFAVEGDGGRQTREIAAARRVGHPHVLRCLDGGIEGDQAYLVMELAEESLHEVLAAPARRAEAWELLRQAARGVAALHEAGLVHRDLKPANVLVAGGVAKVADLGMARGGDLETFTRTGTILGTPQYMAPEQARGEKVGPAADLFALGVMAYELLEGRGPHPEKLELAELLPRLAAGRVDPRRRSRGRLAPDAAAAVDGALAPDPGARPVDAAAWADALGALPKLEADQPPAETTRVLAPPARVDAPSTARIGKPAAPRRGPLVAGAFLALALFVGYLVRPTARPLRPPPPTIDPVAEEDLAVARHDLEARYQELVAAFPRSPSGAPNFPDHLAEGAAGLEWSAFQARYRSEARAPDFLQRWREYLERAVAWTRRMVEARGAAGLEEALDDDAMHIRLVRLPHLAATALRRFRSDDFLAATGVFVEILERFEDELEFFGESFTAAASGGGSLGLAAREVRTLCFLEAWDPRMYADLADLARGIRTDPGRRGSARRATLIAEVLAKERIQREPGPCERVRQALADVSAGLTAAPDRRGAWLAARELARRLPTVELACAAVPDDRERTRGSMEALLAILAELDRVGDPPLSSREHLARADAIHDAWERLGLRGDPDVGCAILKLEAALAGEFPSAWRELRGERTLRDFSPPAWFEGCELPPGPAS